MDLREQYNIKTEAVHDPFKAIPWSSRSHHALMWPRWLWLLSKGYYPRAGRWVCSSTCRRGSRRCLLGGSCHTSGTSHWDTSRACGCPWASSWWRGPASSSGWCDLAGVSRNSAACCTGMSPDDLHVDSFRITVKSLIILISPLPVKSFWFFFMFFKDVSSAQQACIYLIQSTAKTVIVKYFYHLK